MANERSNNQLNANPAPPTLDHVIGQSRAVAQLKVALAAHFNDRAVSVGTEIALPHVLLVGPAGVGKSTIAQIIASEVGVEASEELAQNLITPAHINGFMMSVTPSGVAFVDEIQELKSQVTLYRILEEQRVFLAGSRTSIMLPPVCFIGATTDEWSLSKPLRDRFKIILRLTHYSEVEIKQIIAERCRRLGWSVEDVVVQGIASRSRGTPRLAVRLLEATQRQARASDLHKITASHFRAMLVTEGYDDAGLDITEQTYMQILRESPEPVRLNVLATRLGLPRRTIEGVVAERTDPNGLGDENGSRAIPHTCRY
ncbi:MAG: AAA family ATPase [Tepidisphaeraceae bacterium]